VDGLPIPVVFIHYLPLVACRSDVCTGRGSTLEGGSAEEDGLKPLRPKHN